MTMTADGVPRPFNGAAVTQQTDRCLNHRHRGAGCTHCVAACPVDAITLVDGAPVLAAETCVQCGICLHSCPTGVFTQPNAAEAQLLHAAAQRPDQPLVVVCALHPSPAQTTAPVTTILYHRRCLAALAVDQLLALSQDGARSLWLDDTPCAACPIGAAQAVLQQNVTTANVLLQAFERAPALYLQGEHEEQLVDSAPRRPLIDVGNPPVNRRGLFTALGRAVRNQHDAAPPTLATPGTVLPVSRLPQQVPAALAALQARLQQWETPTDGLINVADLPFATVQVDPARCSACGLCARFCPTGALHFVAEAEQFTLSFQPAICLDCPICTAACPEDAIRVGDTLTVVALVSEEWLPLTEGQLTRCTQCGVPTAGQAGESTPARCYSCQQGSGLVQPLRDEAGLMADLLARVPKGAAHSSTSSAT